MNGVYRFGKFEVRSLERLIPIDGENVPLEGPAFDLLLAWIERRERERA